MKTLFELKKEGVVRAVGFSGAFSLHNFSYLSSVADSVLVQVTPFLLFSASLASSPLTSSPSTSCNPTATTPSVPALFPSLLPSSTNPLSSQPQLQNLTLTTYLPLFTAAGVKQVITASPLSMGLLRSAGAQPWHPASPELQSAALEAKAACDRIGVEYTDVALAYGFASAKKSGEPEGRETPTVVGLSTPEEVHETMAVYSSIYGEGKNQRTGRNPGEGLTGEKAAKQLQAEKEVVEIFRRTKTLNWTWACGINAL
jgi:hypothetical protein